MNFPISRSREASTSLKPLLGGVLLSCCAALTACDDSSSTGGAASPSSEAPTNSADEMPRFSAEIGCTGVSGPLDNLQSGLADRLGTGLAEQPGGAYAGQLASVVVQTLDVVDALANGAGSLTALSSGGDPSLVAPAYHELLCLTAAVAELLVSASLDATTPLAEQEALQGQLDILVELQRILLGGAQSLPNVLDPARVAEDLGYVTQTLAGVVGSLANSTLPGDVDDAVLMPVAGLLLDVTASLNALSSGDTQAFAQQLVDSVAGLVDALAERLGPLGVILNPVNALLTPALNALAALLGGLLGIVL